MIQAIGPIIQLGMSLWQAKQQDELAESRSGISGQNAAAMQKEAEYQQFRTSVLLKRQKDYTAKVLGSQRAAYAKAGIQVDTGTALKVAEDTAAQAAEDAMLIKQEGQFNYERALAGVNMYQQQAKDITRAGYVETGTTLLTGGWDFVKNMGWV